MSRTLPAAPSLEHLRKEAKALLRAAREGDPAAAERLGPPRDGRPPGLARAQWAVARDYGFPSWPRLRAYVQRTGGRADMLHPFRQDAQYYDERVEGLLSVARAGLPSALALLRRHLPHFAAVTDAQASAAVTAADARQVFAREHGFPSWSAFRAHLRALRAGTAWEPFRAAFQALEGHRSAELAAVLDRHPYLVGAAGTNGNTLLNLAAGVLVSPDYSRLPEPWGGRGGMECVRLLLERGADPNRGNHRGWTPLHQAGYSNHRPLAEVLLAAGARTDGAAHGEGGTPLVMALFWGHREVAELLAGHDLAPGNLRVAAGLGRCDLIRQLVPAPGRPLPAAGAARAFHRPHSGFPAWQPTDDPQEVLDEALVWAAKSDRVEALELLVELGARVNADPYRGTPLGWAAAQGRQAAIRRLVELGADPSQQATFGGLGHGKDVTALHLAAQCGRRETCSLLLELGADPTLHDGLFDSPPAGWAAHFGHHGVAAMLRAAGG